VTPSFAAVDLGASSGRVMLADLSDEAIALREVHRFVNRPVTVVSGVSGPRATDRALQSSGPPAPLWLRNTTISML